MFWCRLKRDCELTIPESLSNIDAETWAAWRYARRRLLRRSLSGLPIARAEEIRMWSYQEGQSYSDFREANETWLLNVQRLIHACGGPAWLRRRRHQQAFERLKWLSDFGLIEFKHGKSKHETIIPRGVNLRSDVADIERMTKQMQEWTEPLSKTNS